MKKLLILCMAVFMVLGFVGVASAALTFQTDFGQDGSFENIWTLQPSEFVFIDLYVSGVPAGADVLIDPLVGPPTNINGLASFGVDVTYDPAALSVTPGTVFNMPPLVGGAELTPGSIVLSGVNFQALVDGSSGPSGDLILFGTIELHCDAATGLTDLYLFDPDRGGAFDHIVLFDGTVLDGDLAGGIKLAEINQVPIPGAIWLLGSGLLGLIGLRRRAKKE